MKRTGSPLSIAFDDMGQGEPALLCMPGWCVDRSVFAELARAAGQYRRTLSLDWRGHGESASSAGDFGEAALLDDALAVIQEASAHQVVPVALAHSGWVAIELRRKLADRVPAIVLVDWLILEPPLPFIAALEALQDPAKWQSTRDQLFSMWSHGVDNPKVLRVIREVMGSFHSDMWARGGREIGAAYRREGSPLKALAKLSPHVPVLHVYAQPDDPNFLHAQKEFSKLNPWFMVQKVKAKSHFPMMELPDELASSIDAFVRGAIRERTPT